MNVLVRFVVGRYLSSAQMYAGLRIRIGSDPDRVLSGKFSTDPYPDPISTLDTYVKLYKQGKNILKIELLHIFK